MSETPEMVERVALALEAAAMEHGSKVNSETTAQEFTRIMARAAIEAMREPTDAMKVAGGLKLEAMLFEGDPDCTGNVFEDMAFIHRPMIDTALTAAKREHE